MLLFNGADIKLYKGDNSGFHTSHVTVQLRREEEARREQEVSIHPMLLFNI